MRVRLGVILVTVAGLTACSPEQKPNPAGNQELAEGTASPTATIAPKIAPAAPAASDAEIKKIAAEGEKLFSTTCVACHDAGGADGIGPGLANSALAKGTPEAMAEILVKGRSGSTGTMPGAPYLTDPEIAAIATYVRSHFGKVADPVVTAAQVAASR